LNVACDVAATAAGAPGACSVLSGAMTILSFIDGLDSSSNSQAQVLSQLNSLNQQMVQVDADIKQFWTAFNNAAYQIENTQQLQIQAQIQSREADAKDAAARLSTWIAEGKSDPLLIASIDQQSSQAAMELTTPAFYYRTGSYAGSPNVFDLRQPLLSYLYALTVRLAVISAEDPNYRCKNNVRNFLCNMPYNDELQTHLNFLNSLPGLNAPNISYGHQLQPAPGTYAMCDYAQDDNSSYTSQSDNQGNPPFGGAPSGCVGPYGINATQANDVMQFLAFWDKWWVEDEMGVHAIQKVARTVTTDMSYDWPPIMTLCLPGHPCPPQYNSTGPMVDNGGLCLSKDHGTYPFVSGLYVEPCSKGAEYQTWSSAGMGQTGSLGLSDQTACLEVNLWLGWNNVQVSDDVTPCSGSPGEEYTVTSANEMRWSRDTSLCLQSNGANQPVTLQTCDGQPHQKWGRDWPFYLPPPVHVGPVL
jgi:hypothetical protein